jgi:hypothetical protein
MHGGAVTQSPVYVYAARYSRNDTRHMAGGLVARTTLIHYYFYVFQTTYIANRIAI